jgi:uncharacterized protein YbdZ (MbtH family)
VLSLLSFLKRNGMLTPKYARLAVRYAWRRLLTPAGWRWQTDGLLFFGRKLQIQIGRRGTIRFGRFVWVGDGTKIRCHEGEVIIGAKTVLGQECTISAFQHVEVGRECVVADRVMMIDFDHGVVEVERPIRLYEGQKDAGQHIRHDANACVFHPDDNFRSLPLGRQPDVPSGFRVFCGVVQEVCHHLLQPVWVGVEPDSFSRYRHQ